MNGLNEYGRLRRVLVRPVRELFDAARIEREWRALNFSAPPDPVKAAEQYAAFTEVVACTGARLEEYTSTEGVTLDGIYVRDASIVTPRGIVLARMGKSAREGEPASQRRAYQALGIPVIGAIQPPGLLEGGDLIWFDDRTLAVGRGYRTNDDGIRQLRELLDPDVQTIVVPLPHYRGPADVFHLMSLISPVDERLAVVYSRLLPVPFRQWLLERRVHLVEVPDEEFESMGANVLAIAPRHCVMVEGSPTTLARLEAAGATVVTYDGSEISLKGGGGPTCLTRPLARG